MLYARYGIQSVYTCLSDATFYNINTEMGVITDGQTPWVMWHVLLLLSGDFETVQLFFDGRICTGGALFRHVRLSGEIPFGLNKYICDR